MPRRPGAGALGRGLLLTVLTCLILGVLPASASALATLSGKVYWAPTICIFPPCDVGAPNVPVEIRTSANAIVKTLNTAADGTFSTQVFGNAGGFDYNVYVEGFNATAKFQHVNPANGLRQVQAFDGIETANINFRVTGSVVTGHVFHDLDDDGVLDAGEGGVANASVAVSGAASKNVTTNVNGDWTTGAPVLPAGGYSATASKTDYDASTGAALASPAVGGSDAADDFGLHFKTGTVSGIVYAETNGTPGRQSEEPPIPGVTLTVGGVYDSHPFSLPTLSQADGSFSLPVFIGTNRTIIETQPLTYADGPEFTPLAGPTPGADTFTTLTVADAADTGPLQFGETGATISGVTFSDRDAEGLKDAGEPTIGNRQISVTAAGFAVTVTSAPDGTFVVGGVPAGDVTFTPEATVDALAPVARILHPTLAGTLTDENFGYRFTGLAGKVIDRASGLPLADAIVTLSGAADQTTTTDAGGNWAFVDLLPGTYALAAAKDGFDAAASVAGDLAGAAQPGAVVGIGAGLGEQGKGYELGLTPHVSPQPGSQTPGGATPDNGQPQGQSTAKVGRRVRVVAGKRVRIRKSKLKLGCRLDAGIVRSCKFTVVGKRSKVLARGSARAKKPGTSLTVSLKLTKLGKRLLKASRKGVACSARVTATQAGGPNLKARKKIVLRR